MCKKTNRYIYILFIIFIPNNFSQFSRPISIDKINLKFLHQILKCLLTSEGLVIKTKIKALKNLTIALWSQKCDRVASFVLGILQRCLTNSYSQPLYQKSETTFQQSVLSRLNFFCIGPEAPGCLEKFITFAYRKLHLYS